MRNHRQDGGSLPPARRLHRLAFALLVLSVGLGFPVLPAARAATFDGIWTAGSTLGDQTTSLVVDTAGNAYLTGYFRGTVDFDPGSNTVNLSSVGDDDVYVVKLDPGGALVWARAVGGGGLDRGLGVAVDAGGNVVITGFFADTADFDPGGGVANLTSDGGADVFILKLDPSGAYAWARRVGGLSNEQGTGIAADLGGNVQVTGFYQDTVDFDPGGGTVDLTTAGSVDIFALKLDQNGDFVWAGSLGGGNPDIAGTVAVDTSGNVYLTGSFQGTADLDPGAGTANLTSNGDNDVYIVKLDPAGALVWARAVGGGLTDIGADIIVDGSGNVLVAGNFSSSVDFDPGPATTDLTSNANTEDAFALKLSADGSFVWVRAFGSSAQDQGTGLVADAAGNVYLTGYFLGTIDFDPGPGTVNLAPTGTIDSFVVKLDPTGALVWVRAFGGSLSTVARSPAVSATGHVALGGYYIGTVDFDPGPGTASRTSAGNDDAFALHLEQAAPPVNGLPAPPTTAEDTPLVFSTANGNRVSVSDADAGASPLRVSLAVTNGTLSLSGTAGLTFSQGDGTADPAMTFAGALAAVNAALEGLTFTPAANVNGAATLQMTTQDQVGPTGGQTDAGSLGITVTAVNDRPTAAADSYTVAAGTTLTVPASGVLANDADVDAGTTLQAERASNPTGGLLTLNADGGFTYTPRADFAGTDSFAYRASDGTATSDPTTVTVTVTPLRCTPRPRVQAQPVPGGGRLQVRISATPLSAQENNVLSELRFGQLDNARVTLNGQQIAANQPYIPPPNTVAVDFTVERIDPSRPTTVHLTAVDACGTFPTFVGGGGGAF